MADLCSTPEIAGAGFINFRLQPEALAARFKAAADRFFAAKPKGMKAAR